MQWTRTRTRHCWWQQRTASTRIQERGWHFINCCNGKHHDHCHNQCPQMLRRHNGQHPRCLPAHIQWQGNVHATLRMLTLPSTENTSCMEKTTKHYYTSNFLRKSMAYSKVPSFSTKKCQQPQELWTPFIINLYDPCVANATIAGLQMIVTWHVNDLKISHIDPTKSQNSVNTLHLSMAMASWYIEVKSTNILAWTSILLWTVSLRYQWLPTPPKSSWTSPNPSPLPVHHQPVITSSQYEMPWKLTFYLRNKLRLFTTLWHNSYSSANAHAGIFKPLSPSWPPESNARVRTIGAN